MVRTAGDEMSDPNIEQLAELRDLIDLGRIALLTRYE